jgi:hypothetical protein
MNKTIHIFYNGFDYSCPLPQDDKWSNYVNSTSPRMFLQTAVSWQRNGWEVRRISSVNVGGINAPESFCFKGRLRESLERYPYHYWNLWKLLADMPEPCKWVCNMDCYNQDYTPEEAHLDLRSQQASQGCMSGAVCLHVNRWSNAIFYAGPSFAQRVCDMIEDYDEGHGEPLVTDFVHDELLIRELLQKHYVTVPRCDFGFIKPHWEKAPLINISRSTISRAMATIPVVR